MNIAVTGAGGGLAGHLIRRLLDDGHAVRAVDVKDFDHWWQCHEDADNRRADLSEIEECRAVLPGIEQIYHLAAEMGGISFITRYKARCAFNVLITAHLLQAALENDVERFFYTSSACVYNTALQVSASVGGLREVDAWPALPEEGYGLEKLYGEELCRYVAEDYGLVTRVARLHNVFGPFQSFSDGREKAPAAICRKVAHAVRSNTGEIEIWGDGEQTRSFLYVDDFVEGAIRIMQSNHPGPVNLGSEREVTIDELADIVEHIAGVKLHRRYDLDAPEGVRGRNSDNTLLRKVTGWEPQVPLETGLANLYSWIEKRM